MYQAKFLPVHPVDNVKKKTFSQLPDVLIMGPEYHCCTRKVRGVNQTLPDLEAYFELKSPNCGGSSKQRED